MGRLLLMGLVTGIFVGCAEEDTGPPRVQVAGMVKLDGAPLPEGGIILQPADGGPGVGCKIVDGAFTTAESKGAVPGTQMVTVTIPDWAKDGTESINGIAIGLPAEVPKEGTDSLVLNLTKRDVKREQ
ncbi:MAG: hypothetical protein ABJZ55_10355 [Fuerstiella sp.]